jgi:hypothetical protein
MQMQTAHGLSQVWQLLIGIRGQCTCSVLLQLDEVFVLQRFPLFKASSFFAHHHKQNKSGLSFTYQTRTRHEAEAAG